MKLLTAILCTAIFFASAPAVYAAENSEIANFTNQTLQTLIVFASLGAVFFLVKGGYGYITSAGKPDSLEHAKHTIRNALIGLTFVIGAAVIQSLLMHAFNTPSANTDTNQISLTPIQSAEPSGGLTQVLIDAIVGVLQNIIQSATKPIVDGIISFLTTTPSIINNSVLFNFWLVILGITDSLFVLIIALLGFHFMSASTFGFDEIEFKHLLPRIGLAFLGANMSIFLVDWIVLSCNVLVKALLNATGGISGAWVLNAFDPTAISTGATPLITLIFMILFLIVSVVLLLMYISRLIIISVGAVLSPLIFLLWAVPKFADFAEISIKTYAVSVYTVFVHVVIIQLTSAFLTIPGQSGTNSLISILVGVGMLFTLLKTPSTMMQLVQYTSSNGAFKKVGTRIVNVISTSASQSGKAGSVEIGDRAVKVARRAVHA